MASEPTAPLEFAIEQTDDEGRLLFVQLDIDETKSSQGRVLVRGTMGLKQGLELKTQLDMIRIATTMLREMEANLVGGVGAVAGQKAVKA